MRRTEFEMSKRDLGCLFLKSALPIQMTLRRGLWRSPGITINLQVMCLLQTHKAARGSGEQRGASRSVSWAPKKAGARREERWTGRGAPWQHSSGRQATYSTGRPWQLITGDGCWELWGTGPEGFSLEKGEMGKYEQRKSV